ncbi:hypothetical protein [uncultured Clostridium sp.]|uniref:hypothetical protein n=1 Tax=uncultured Clostridium sp. TaxID=59620 RepID=UPI002731F5C4|nr:hypothetical protein [uncultured Clostridium sp.]
MHLRELLKETILLLISLHVIYFLLPKWTKRFIRSVTKIAMRLELEVFNYAKKAYKNNCKNKKVIPKEQEQPSNIIYITYPNGKIKSYRKAK